MLANRDRTAHAHARSWPHACSGLKRERRKQKTAIFACLGVFSVFGVFVAWSRRKKERRRDTHRTLEREELSKQKDIECMRAMCFLLGVWYLVTD